MDQAQSNSATQAGTSKSVSGADKAATLLLFLGEKISAEVFRRLSDQEVTEVSRAISRLGAKGQKLTDLIIRESYSELVRGQIKMRGDMDYAQRVIESAYSPDTAREILKKLSIDELSMSQGIKHLRQADPRQLAKVIQEEHPQAIAVVLAHLEPEQAAETIGHLPEAGRSEVCVRLAGLDQLSQPIRDQVTDTIASRLAEPGPTTESTGGPRRVAEIFNRMDREVSQETLQVIEEEDPNLALSIRNLMFVFNDILLISDNDMRKLIQRVDKKVLVQALKGTEQELKDHFFRNMSQRAGEMLEEDMEAIGPVRKSDAKAAQQEIVTLIRQMEADGEISLGESGGDQYVV